VDWDRLREWLERDKSPNVVRDVLSYAKGVHNLHNRFVIFNLFMWFQSARGCLLGCIGCLWRLLAAPLAPI